MGDCLYFVEEGHIECYKKFVIIKQNFIKKILDKF